MRVGFAGSVRLTVVLMAATVLPQSAAEWRSLFNGRDLTGWTIAAGRTGGPTPAQPAAWKVEDGVLVGGQGPGRGSLMSTRQFRDFELDLQFMLAEHGTRCSADLIGPAQENASEDRGCLYNSGVYFRTAYQVNLGRQEAGEFIGVIVRRNAPGAIRGNVLWLDKGDERFPGLRRKEDWNHLNLRAKGPRITVTLNGTTIADIEDDPVDPAESKLKDAAPVGFQWPPSSEAGGFQGYVKFRNIRIREI